VPSDYLHRGRAKTSRVVPLMSAVRVWSQRPSSVRGISRAPQARHAPSRAPSTPPHRCAKPPQAARRSCVIADHGLLPLPAWLWENGESVRRAALTAGATRGSGPVGRWFRAPLSSHTSTAQSSIFLNISSRLRLSLRHQHGPCPCGHSRSVPAVAGSVESSQAAYARISLLAIHCTSCTVAR